MPEPENPGPLLPDAVMLPPARISALRMALRVGLILLAALALHLLIGWLMEQTQSLPGMQARAARAALTGVILLAYALLIAVPFVPGIEIGLSVMMLQGPGTAPFVWAATVLGLFAAYMVGCLTPYSRLRNLVADLRLRRVCALIEMLEAMPREQRLQALNQRLPRPLRPLLIRQRYLLLALLINLPGNAVIGGGGGLALLAGLSRLYAPRATALTMALACMPVPLAVWYWDIDIVKMTGFGR